MARPIIKRNIRTYSRDIEALRRLRTAIQMDQSLDTGRAATAIADITRTLASLNALCDSLRVCA